MSWLAWIVLGLIAGSVARAMVAGGLFASLGIGVVGALLGGWLSTRLNFGGLAGDLDWRNLVIALLGSVILLAVRRLVRGPRHR